MSEFELLGAHFEALSTALHTFDEGPSLGYRSFAAGSGCSFTVSEEATYSDNLGLSETLGDMLPLGFTAPRVLEPLRAESH